MRRWDVYNKQHTPYLRQDGSGTTRAILLVLRMRLRVSFTLKLTPHSDSSQPPPRAIALSLSNAPPRSPFPSWTRLLAYRRASPLRHDVAPPGRPAAAPPGQRLGLRRAVAFPFAAPPLRRAATPPSCSSPPRRVALCRAAALPFDAPPCCPLPIRRTDALLHRVSLRRDAPPLPRRPTTPPRHGSEGGGDAPGELSAHVGAGAVSDTGSIDGAGKAIGAAGAPGRIFGSSLSDYVAYTTAIGSAFGVSMAGLALR